MPVLQPKALADGAAQLLRLVEEFEETMMLSAHKKQAKAAAAIAKRFVWSARSIAIPRRRWGSAQAADASQAINTAAVRTYLAGLREAGKSRKTVLNHRSAISLFCEFLAERGTIAAGGNPCRQIRLAKPEKLPARYLTAAEARRVLQAAADAGIAAEVGIALGTGVRLAELARLEWRDVDLSRRQILVPRSKSGRFRVVPLNASACRILAGHQEITGQFSYVFPARRTWRGGWRYVEAQRSASSWRRIFMPVQRAVAKFCELPGCSTGRAWHLLRHTFASQLAQAGVSIYQIADWLGHSNIEMAQRYAHLQTGYQPSIEAADPAKWAAADPGA